MRAGRVHAPVPRTIAVVRYGWTTRVRAFLSSNSKAVI